MKTKDDIEIIVGMTLYSLELETSGSHYYIKKYIVSQDDLDDPYHYPSLDYAKESNARSRIMEIYFDRSDKYKNMAIDQQILISKLKQENK